MFVTVLGHYLRGLYSTPTPSHDNKKCLQTLSNVPLKVKLLMVGTHHSKPREILLVVPSKFQLGVC
jgi:hypothetical protein